MKDQNKGKENLLNLQNWKSVLSREELCERLIAASPDPIVFIESDLTISYASPKFVQTFGFHSLEEIAGRNILEFLELSARAEAEKNISLIMRGEIKPVNEYRFLKKGGGYFIGQVTSSVIGDPSEADKKTLIFIIKDISERKYYEKTQSALYRISEAVHSTTEIYDLYRSIHQIVKELMPADNFYIALYDPSDNLINFPYFVDQFDECPESRKPGRGLTEYIITTGKDMLVDEKLDLEMRSKGLIEMIGQPTKIWLGVALKLYGETFGAMVVQDYEDENAYGEQEKQLLIFVSEQIASALDKKRHEDELMRYNEELQISRDMLEERAAEFVRLNEQLAASETELQELNASKDKFFSILAHDLRSPFNGLIGFSNILVEDVNELSKDEIKNFALQIHASAKSLFNLIENLLQWSRIQSGKMPYQPIRLDIHETVNDVISILIGNAIRKNISLRSDINPFTYAFADQNMLFSILQNLVANAIKFTGNNGEVNIDSKLLDGFIEISVADTGVGIREDDMDKIFRIDVQHTTLGTQHEKGTGLGLILCKELVEKHGGHITVESEFKKGTTFSFTVPVPE